MITVTVWYKEISNGQTFRYAQTKSYKRIGKAMAKFIAKLDTNPFTVTQVSINGNIIATNTKDL